MGGYVWWSVLLIWLLKPKVCCGGTAANDLAVICRWRGESPSVGESVAVGLGMTGVEAEFPIGVDE
jgi:hypothetical protein